MKIITAGEFVEMLRNHKGATPIGMITVTQVKDVVGKVYHKFSTPCGFMGFDYQNSVNNAQEKQGEERDFVAQPRKWGKHVNACLIEHNGKFYLQLKAQKSRIKPFYMSNGQIFARIEQKKRSNPDHGVIVRDYSIDTIKQITYKGETYRIV